MSRFVKLVRVLAYVGLLVVGTGMVCERWARWSAPRKYPPPGIMVDVGDHRMHLHCTGSGSPTVVLESGAGSSSAVWRLVQPQLGKVTRVCSYDRLGFGWSSRPRAGRDPLQAADDLHELLGAASIRPPYLMVGHSLGGPRIMIYDRLFPGEAESFVFVEATDVESASRYPAAYPVPPPPGPTTERVMMRGMAAIGGIRLLASLDGPSADPEISMRIRASRAFAPQSIRFAHQELDQLGATLDAAREWDAGSRPVVVITAGEWVPGGLTPNITAEVKATRLTLQQELASSSPNSDHRIVDSADHFVQIESPESVVAAISDVVRAIRSPQPIR